MSDSGKPDSPTRWIKRALLSLTLAGLPELEHFPTPEARETALEEIATEAGNPKKGAYWLSVLLIVVAVVLVRFTTAWLLSFVSLPNWLEDMLRILAIFLAFTVVLRRLHRSGVAAELRTRLLAVGVPVCMGCGYLLRGLTVEIGRCPECARAFDADARRILSAPSVDDR